jgi:signal transduction histidine kinase
MKLKIFSHDGELHRLCQEILADIAPGHWTASASDIDGADERLTLTLWQYRPDAPIPDHISASPSKFLVLVDRKDLLRFREAAGAARLQILLKPATRAALSAFLGSALASTAALDSTSKVRLDEREEILERLTFSNLRLQEYDQDRTTFLARAAHDFRAPLTALVGYCGLIINEPLGPVTEGQREVLLRMLHSSKRLSRMAAAMFQLSIDHHVKRRPNLQRGNIRERVEQALHEIGPFAEDRGIVLTTDLNPPEGELCFDSGEVEQVLINILENACKFTPKAGAIDVRGYPYFWERRTTRSSVPRAIDRRRRAIGRANAYRIDITDSGQAIPQEHLREIFEEYTSCSGNRDQSGGGLGLAIARMILDKHAGRIWAENTQGGPMFCVILPVQEPGYAPASEAETQVSTQSFGGPI